MIVLSVLLQIPLKKIQNFPGSMFPDSLDDSRVRCVIGCSDYPKAGPNFSGWLRHWFWKPFIALHCNYLAFFSLSIHEVFLPFGRWRFTWVTVQPTCHEIKSENLRNNQHKMSMVNQYIYFRSHMMWFILIHKNFTRPKLLSPTVHIYHTLKKGLLQHIMYQWIIIN